MSQKKRSVTLSHTIYQWLEVLVSTGQYSSLDDAATDLLMQLKRGTPLVLPSTPLVPQSTSPVLSNTTKQAIVDTPAIVAISESLVDELARLQSLPKLEKLKNMNRITELKQLIEA